MKKFFGTVFILIASLGFSSNLMAKCYLLRDGCHYVCDDGRTGSYCKSDSSPDFSLDLYPDFSLEGFELECTNGLFATLISFDRKISDNGQFNPFQKKYEVSGQHYVGPRSEGYMIDTIATYSSFITRVGSAYTIKFEMAAPQLSYYVHWRIDEISSRAPRFSAHTLSVTDANGEVINMKCEWK